MATPNVTQRPTTPKAAPQPKQAATKPEANKAAGKAPAAPQQAAKPAAQAAAAKNAQAAKPAAQTEAAKNAQAAKPAAQAEAVKNAQAAKPAAQAEAVKNAQAAKAGAQVEAVKNAQAAKAGAPVEAVKNAPVAKAGAPVEAVKNAPVAKAGAPVEAVKNAPVAQPATPVEAVKNAPVAKAGAPVEAVKNAPVAKAGAPVEAVKNAPVAKAGAPVEVAKNAPVAQPATPVEVAKNAPVAKAGAPVEVAKNAPALKPAALPKAAPVPGLPQGLEQAAPGDVAQAAPQQAAKPAALPKAAPVPGLPQGLEQAAPGDVAQAAPQPAAKPAGQAEAAPAAGLPQGLEQAAPEGVAQAAPQPQAAQDLQGPAAGPENVPAAAPGTPAPAVPPAAQQRQGPMDLQSDQAKAYVQQTLDYLRQQQGGNALAADQDSAQDFSARAVEQDELGMTHVRMDRMFEGVSVYGEQVIGHIGKDGKMIDSTGELNAINAGLGNGQVQVTQEQALAAAAKDFNGQAEGNPAAKRVVFRDDAGNYRSAYHVQMNNVQDVANPRRMNYFVDANTGEMITSYNQMGGIHQDELARLRANRQAGGNAPAVPQPGVPAQGEGNAIPAAGPGGAANDTSLYSGKVDLQTTQNANGTWRLEDASRGNGVVTYDAQNRPEDGPLPNTPFTDQNDVWGEAGDNSRNRAAVDAQYGAQMTYDFMRDVLGRNSIDGKGEKLNSYVHAGRNVVNAFWDGEKMIYGDGDGVDAGPLTTLDIAGHEIAHGLTERTANLEYRGESGGLNEAFSDIMGTGVEWYASQKNPNVKFDWSLGEDAWTPGTPGDALRYMDDPSRDDYSIDNYRDYPRQTEVHGSSGIANNAFYLLANGGKNRTSGLEVANGIGMEKGLKIYHRALANYMTPQTNFAQARQATLRAARDLYGENSPEVQRVIDSWTAVGVK